MCNCNILKFRKLFCVCFLFLICFYLTGCLSHLFLESETRLQVENLTQDCTIISIDVISEDSSKIVPWITETILPGERSRVVQADWVGEFNLRIKYKKSNDDSNDYQVDLKKFELEGGSIYLIIKGKSSSLEYIFK